MISRSWAQTPIEATSGGAAPPGAGTGADTLGEVVDAAPDLLFGTLERWIAGFFRLAPNILVGLLVLALFVALGWAINRSFRGWARRHDRQNLGEVLGSFLRWVTILFGTLLALTIVLPTLRPGDLIAGLGIGSVAIGFAFKDILQNWLAGLLLLLRRPFRVGDQIVVNGYEGTIQWIETRATIIKTYDGRQVIIPNADVYSNAVTVNTAHGTRRSEYDVGIGYGDDIGEARDVILEAVSGVSTIESEPAPEVLVWDLGASTVNLRVRWWTHSQRVDVVHARSDVLEAVKTALDRAGIDMPYDTQVLLFHDQTEETDGSRGRQREGWPARPGAEPPQPARLRRREDAQ